jgi:hypothetical protein
VAKFLLVYSNGNPPASQEEGEKVMASWMAWFGRLGPAVADGGMPTAHPARAISPQGQVSDVNDWLVTGYSILEAASLDEATGFAKDCPHLQAGGTVRVYELTPAM